MASRAARSALLGSAVEYYDFTLFATASALVLGPVFFAKLGPAQAAVAAFVTFGSAFVARPLGPMRLLICASPAYLARHGTPTSLNELAAHRTLQLQITSREQPTPFIIQTRNDGARSMQMLPLPARLLCNDFRGLLQACIDGVGIAQLPQPLALQALRDGHIKTLLPEHMLEGWQLFIHYPSRKQLPARLRAFVDFCVEHFGGHADLSADVSVYSQSPINRSSL